MWTATKDLVWLIHYSHFRISDTSIEKIFGDKDNNQVKQLIILRNIL